MMSTAAFNELRTRLRDDMVLSVYIAAAEHSPTERSSWRTTLQQQLNTVAVASGRDRGLARARALVEHELRRFTGFLPGNGWVAFATAQRLWYAAEVRTPVPSLVRWRRGMTLGPYLRVLQQARPVVLALVDSKRARLFRYISGKAFESIDSRANTFIDDLTDRNMSKRAATHSGVRGVTATDTAGRILHVEMERLLKQVASEIMGLAGRDGLVVIGGPTVAAKALHHLLTDQLADRLMIDESAVILMSDAEALATIERCASALSRQLQHNAVEEVLDEIGTTGRGVLGFVHTESAVSVGQVELLLLTRRFMKQHESAAEELIANTLDFAGRVEEVTNAAAELLDVSGGVGARLRFGASVHAGSTRS